MDFNKEVNGITNKIIKEKLPSIVEEKVTGMITHVVGDIFKSYGDVAKDIKKKIEEEIDVNLQQFKLLDYNALIAKTINDCLLKQVTEVSLKPIQSMIKDTIGFIEQDKVTYSQICDWITEAAKEDDYSNDEGEISFHVIKDEKHDWTTICYDFKADVEPKRCRCEFLVSHTNNNRIFIFRTKTTWDAKGEVTPKMMVNMDTIEQKIFRLYAAQVEIVPDSNWDTYWTKYDY